MKLLEICEGNKALEVMFHCTMNNCEDSSSHEFFEFLLFLLVEMKRLRMAVGGLGLGFIIRMFPRSCSLLAVVD